MNSGDHVLGRDYPYMHVDIDVDIGDMYLV